LHHQEKAQTERLVCFSRIAIYTPSCHARVSLCFFTNPTHICTFSLASPLVHSPPPPHPPRQIASLKSSAAQSAKEKAEIEAVLTSTASRLTLVQNDLRGENDALSAQVSWTVSTFYRAFDEACGSFLCILF
jgi:hypothetical protein